MSVIQFDPVEEGNTILMLLGHEHFFVRRIVTRALQVFELKQ